MSRIGKKPVTLPANVKINITGQNIVVDGGKSKLNYTLSPLVDVKVDDKSKQVLITRKDDSREAKAMHGTTRALIVNMIQGVTAGFTKELEVNGVGWTATVQGQKIVLKVGFADPKIVEFPTHVKVEVKENKITVSGIDKQAVGQVAAEIRSKRKPEPYNGKGIKYTTETIIRKQGKAFAGAGAK